MIRSTGEKTFKHKEGHMDIETMVAIDELEALDAIEDEEMLGDARLSSDDPTAC